MFTRVSYKLLFNSAFFICVISIILQIIPVRAHEEDGNIGAETHSHSIYSEKSNRILSEIDKAMKNHLFHGCSNCSCYHSVISEDLKPFKNGVTKELIDEANSKGTRYVITDGNLYREKPCLFPARCQGVEHFLLQLVAELPDSEFIVNTRDWPQSAVYQHTRPLPIFSFSKTGDFYDIMYPAWGFWEGGPAIKLFPRGLGRWDLMRKSLKAAANKTPWEKKSSTAFFRGSRTSGERDEIVLLSREAPQLVDAAYTKNQAWKSEADTLGRPPAEEVSLEDHCKYKYLFNFRGVAASFRFKHLFLCNSLVFHVGEEWLEFFYSNLKPWVHYIPVKKDANRKEIADLLLFFKEHDSLAREIAERGKSFIDKHLRLKDVKCYWRKLLQDYSSLLKFKPQLKSDMMKLS
ncbi:O-glucosyltransferase rumi homolog [Nilaparvata lugens]|uniref:O-glucosyltransferase rumi homolog n=1 Tax=Nilaparvata lugens TaxID=108931 RepID=UPI00193EB943|nr:O-glucosyltransferase rumi homolog [Nilaparvata lugens]